MQISIVNGRIVDPANGADVNDDLHIADGKVHSIGPKPAGFDAERVIDASGLVVCPGLVDLCARLREPGLEQKATIASESLAAVANGITTLCMPPDTTPVVDTPAVAELIHRRAQQAGLARVEVVGALTQGLGGEHLAEMGALSEAGCVGVGNAEQPVKNTEIMRRAMEYAATFDLTVFSRAEDPWLAVGRDMHEGAVSTRLGLSGIPVTAETIALNRDLALAEQTGARTHFLHLSSARAVELVREAKQRGLPVSADVTAHHVHLTEEELDGFNSECHLRPPLRSTADRDGLRAGLHDGTINALCSSHQPHERDARLNPFSATDPGASGLDTLLPLALELVRQEVLSLSQAIQSLTHRPATILGVDRGHLRVGGVADVCVFDPKREWTLSTETMVSQGENTPLRGWTLTGRNRFTLVSGDIVFEDA